jgi:DNA-binding NarL/FixJ family response regulator
MTTTIMLADDHAAMRDGLKALLETQPDIKVTGVAANGREAVDVARRLRPDVVVMDIAMPELNGIDAARRIVASLPRTRIVMLSMHGTSEHIYRALRAGALGYLLKESAGDEVVAAIRAVSRGRRYLSERISETVIADYVAERHTASPLERLSARERAVLQLVVEGRSSAEIATAAALSVKTVESYRSRTMRKLGVGDVTGLVKFAIEHGITTLKANP